MSLLDQLKNTFDLPCETVNVPQWGLDVLIAGLSVEGRGWWNRRIRELNTERDRVAKELHISADEAAVRSSDFVLDYAIPLLAFCMYDPETRKRVFQGVDEAREVLQQKDFTPLMDLMQIATRLSAIGTVVEEKIDGVFPESQKSDSSSV